MAIWRTVYCPSASGNSAIGKPKTFYALITSAELRPCAPYRSVAEAISQGKAHLILDVHKPDNFQAGEVLVTENRSGLGTDYEKAIVTNKVAYLPCSNYCTGDWCSSDRWLQQCYRCFEDWSRGNDSCAEGEEGRVYAGLLPYEVRELPRTRTKIL